MINIKKFIKTICILLSLVLSFGCRNMENNSLAVNVLNKNDSSLVLHNWHVVGPFKQSEKGDMLNFDNLTIFGFNENNIGYNDFSKINSEDLNKEYALDPKFRSITGNNPDDVLNINLVFDAVEAKDAITNSNAYLGCIIRADEESEYYLNFSSDNGAKVWLNNQLIINYDKDISVFSYEQYIPIELKKGDNFFLVKVYNNNRDWLMFAKLEKETQKGFNCHQQIITLLNNNNFLKSSMVDSLNYLEINKNFPFGKYPLIIQNLDDYQEYHEVANIDENWKKNIGLFSEGLYKARIIVANDTLEEYFYKGDIINKTKQLIENKKPQLDVDSQNDLDANVLRFNHLMKPENTGDNLSEKQAWQRKIIYLYRDISAICNASKRSLVNVPGFHIRTYISEIDNHQQYYIIHIPKNYNEKKTYPVVFQIPYKVENRYHYLKSRRVADLELIENLQTLSDKNDIILVEPFAREIEIPNFNRIDEADFFEVFSAIKKDYKINLNQVYFIGICQGAHKALKLAVKNPDILAGMAFISPLFHEPNGYHEQNDWINEAEPLTYIENIRNIPLLIIHSVDDRHLPFQESQQFAGIYESKGLANLEFRKLYDVTDQYYWAEYSDDLIKFLLKHKKVDNPEKVTLSGTNLKGCKAYWLSALQFQRTGIANISGEIDKNNVLNITTRNISCFSIDLEKLPYSKDNEIIINENGKNLYKGKPSQRILTFNKDSIKHRLLKTSKVEGPFCDAFIHKFIIVVGTKGTSKENRRLKDLGDTLVAMWNYKYWNSCAIKYDVDINHNDISSSNLILLGNAKSNSIINKIADELPVRIDTNGITIREKKIEGKKLGFYLIYPNPMNKNKYAALIGYNNPNSISLGAADLDKENYKGYKDWLKLRYMEVSCFGWYDFKIWDENNDDQMRGFFSPCWE